MNLRSFFYHVSWILCCILRTNEPAKSTTCLIKAKKYIQIYAKTNFRKNLVAPHVTKSWKFDNIHLHFEPNFTTICIKFRHRAHERQKSGQLLTNFRIMKRSFWGQSLAFKLRPAASIITRSTHFSADDNFWSWIFAWRPWKFFILSKENIRTSFLTKIMENLIFCGNFEVKMGSSSFFIASAEFSVAFCVRMNQPFLLYVC